ncbi:MAG: hypothetical protein ACRECQ_07590 [Burkholderiaceae bacterium]
MLAASPFAAMCGRTAFMSHLLASPEDSLSNGSNGDDTMKIANKTRFSAVLACALLTLGLAPSAIADEPEENFVCDIEQVLPGFGFLPITISPEIAALLGIDPDECQTPVEP